MGHLQIGLDERKDYPKIKIITVESKFRKIILTLKSGMSIFIHSNMDIT